jgi:maltose alpha-D-glucosyltransferase/alpha-amylase
MATAVGPGRGSVGNEETVSRRGRNSVPLSEGGRLWYKDAVIYEVPVRAFRDSNGDGVGDFKGLVGKLDYLQDLGVSALWLLPFYPSPLRDDGYDIADYREIHPRYGSLADFRLFLREAHRRGLRVITELVVNHTSDQHPWFQRARNAPPGHPDRDFYVWSDTTDRYREARIIFKDFESSNWTWDPVARAYFWHRFYSHQPDLNYDNLAVQDAVIEVLDYWLGMGIDGLRLDAIPYLYEREGTNCENLPETHAFLKKLRHHVDERFPGRMLLAEANQWPEDAVAYFGQGDGDECHMAFHFPVMPRLFMAIRMEDRLPILDILQQTPPIPPSSQWALFLRNHDELTLEMVTDEDRDYMYRVYASDPQARINLGIRRRLAPLLENHRARIELMHGLLFSLPGTPVLYYGDEIGMGDNIYLGDRNGVRTPMQWTPDRNAGFSSANPQSLYLPLIIDPEYHFQAINVEVQQSNPHSLLWWTKRLIDLRNHHPAFGRGSIRFLTPDNHKVLAFIRSLRQAPGDLENGHNAEAPPATSFPNPHTPFPVHDDDILVVANLSRVPQYVELDLGAFAGHTPVELTGHSAFPAIADRPYFLILGPYAFYWFSLVPGRQPTTAPDGVAQAPTIEVAERWDNVFVGDAKERLQEWLPEYMQRRSWIDKRGRQVEAAMILESLPLLAGDDAARLALVQVEYSEGDPETYVLPLAFAAGDKAKEIQSAAASPFVAGLQLRAPGDAITDGILYDPVADPAFAIALADTIANRRRSRRAGGELHGITFGRERHDGVPAEHGRSGTVRKGGRSLMGIAESPPSAIGTEQRHSTVVFGDRLVVKLFRRIEEGKHPEVEMGEFLARRTDFRNTPRIVGALEYRRGWGEPMTIGVVHEFVANQGDAWRYCFDALGIFYERARARPERGDDLPLPSQPLTTLAFEPIPALAEEMIGPLLEALRLLGRRTAELHGALGSVADDDAFAPEPFTSLLERSLYQSLRTQIRQAFVYLKRRLASLPEALRPDAENLLKREDELLVRIRRSGERRQSGCRTRIHGDYSLREVLYDGRDFFVIDFEGDTTRPLGARRRKYSPLRDVASMLRSLHFVARLALDDGAIRTEDRPVLRPWSRLWHTWTSAAFLRSYLESMADNQLIPQAAAERDSLLDHYLVKRAVAELRGELIRSLDTPGRAARIAVPVEGLLQILDSRS